MRAFDHYTPKSLPEALGLLASQNGRARVIAGGTDLIPQMRSGEEKPEVIVNVKQLPELQGLVYRPAIEGPEGEAGLQLGALTTLRELTRSSIIREHYPSLVQAASMMASEQVRSFATVGGNLCNASPSADLAPPLIALGGVACLSGQQGERRVPLEDFFLGPGKSALVAGELLQMIHLPPPQGEAIYLKQASRAFMDLAVVGVAIQMTRAGGLCQDCRIVLGAVAPVPLRVRDAEDALRDRPTTPERIAQAAQTAAEKCTPIDDVRGAAWYRRRMVAVLTRRGLERLVEAEREAQ